MRGADKREDQELFELINRVRANPMMMLDHLEQMKLKFDGELYKRGGDRPNLRTKEGVKAVDEAINAINRIDSCPALRWDDTLANAAKEHVNDTGSRGLLQHESSDNKTVKERFAKFGKFLSCYGENLSFSCETAEEIVAQLIIDDGVPDRGHRDNLFNSEFKVFGCYTGDHRDFDKMTCLEFAGGFVKRGQEDPIEKQMEEFLKETVEFEMPNGVISWKQNSKVNVQGNQATKTVTRVCKLKDGTE